MLPVRQYRKLLGASRKVYARLGGEGAAASGGAREARGEKGRLKGAPAEKGKSKEAPPDNVMRENPRGGTEREGEKGRR